MTPQHLETTSLQNVRVVRMEPKVKSAKTCKLFNAGVSANAGSAKIADPLVYNVSVPQTRNPAVDAAGLFENRMEMKVLHTPNYDVRTRAFCGPTAISAVTGAPISQIREIARGFRGPKSNGHARAIMGMSNKEMLAVMAVLGWRIVQESGDADNQGSARMDVFRFDDFLDAVQLGRHGGDSEGPYIVNVTGHYYAVGWGEVCDTRTQLPTPIHRFKRGRQRWVQRWWKFEKVD